MMRVLGLTVKYADGINYLFDTSKRFYAQYPVGYLLCRIFQGETLDNISGILQGNINAYLYKDEPLSQNSIEKAEKYVLDALKYDDYRPAQFIAQGSFIRCMENYRALDSDTMYQLWAQELERADEVPSLFTDIGFDTVGNFLKLCYNNYYIDLFNAVEFFKAMAAVRSGTASKELEDTYHYFLTVLSGWDKVPGIEMQTLFDPDTGGYSYGYIISSFLAMTIFEFTHIEESAMKIMRCQNPECGKYFTAKRTSAKYCGFPSPQLSTRPCSDYYPQFIYRTKQRENAIDHLTKKALSRLYMDKSRHPEKEKELSRLIRQLQIEAPLKKQDVMDGSMTITQLEEWLNTLRRQKGDTDYE